MAALRQLLIDRRTMDPERFAHLQVSSAAVENGQVRGGTGGAVPQTPSPGVPQTSCEGLPGETDPQIGVVRCIQSEPRRELRSNRCTGQ
jgi:hypothetical protein